MSQAEANEALAEKRGVRRRPPAAGMGRRKGVPNRITADVRVVLREIAEGNAPKVQRWLDRVAVRQPARATALWLKVCEFLVPRHASAPSGPLVALNFGAPLSGGAALDMARLSPEEIYNLMAQGAIAADPAAFRRRPAIEVKAATEPPDDQPGEPK